jgi:hypothetical protein
MIEPASIKSELSVLPMTKRGVKFLRKVIKTSTCWIWNGARRGNYGCVNIGNDIRESSHRLSYKLFVGDIPDGYEIHHKCNNKLCVNPDHLELVTDATHPSVNKMKTHCPHGHEYTEQNTYTYPTKDGGVGRMCKICHRESYRSAYERKVIINGAI